MCRQHYRNLLDCGHVLGTLYAVHGGRIEALHAAISERFPERPELPVTFAVGPRSFEIGRRDLDRLLSKVSAQPDGAWLWEGTINESGYGQLHIGPKNGPMSLAHRVAYTALVGPIPSGLHLDHVLHNESFASGQCAGGSTCLHRRDVNPLHVLPRTRSENLMLGAGSFVGPMVNDLCKHGHSLTGENVHLQTRKNGNIVRICRACKRRAFHEAQARKRARQ